MFFILSAACVTANAFIIKSAQERYKESADTISYYNNFVVLLLFAAGACATGGVTAAKLAVMGKIWWLVLLGGLAQTGIYFFYYRNLKQHEVWMVKLYLLLMPVLSCFIGCVFLSEIMTGKKILGIFVVLLGAAVILLRGKLNNKAERD